MSASEKLDAFFSKLDLHAPETIGADKLERAYLESAAVLSEFVPADLRPTGEVQNQKQSAEKYFETPEQSASEYPDNDMAWDMPDEGPWILHFKEAVEPVVDESTVNRWTISANKRRTILSQIGGRKAIQAAIDANPQRPDDPTQRAFEAIIAGKRIDINKLARQDLYGLIQASSWLEGVIEDLPDIQAIKSQLDRVDLIQTFRKLVGNHFSGREKELRKLRDYVGFIPSDSMLSIANRAISSVSNSFMGRRPMVIHGPGGIGKSTLLAKFILDHFESVDQGQFPFAYLNFDRSRLEAGQPLTLIIDAAWQLGIQFSHAQKEFGYFAQTASEHLSRQDAMESSKSGVAWEEIFHDFSKILLEAAPGDAPFVLVLDTFEEVQFLGPQYVAIVLEFLVTLQQEVPRLRAVIAGRAPIERGLFSEELELHEFDLTSARSAARLIFEELGINPDKEVLAQIVDTVGGNPLSLWLAARIVKEEGAKALESIKTRRLLLLRMKSEQIQAILHGRILTHLHDKNLVKIAYPGLLVRRITPEIIAEVLAGPCKLQLKTPDEATQLFELLQREVALVEPDRDDPENQVLRHRENVRRLMLDDLARVQPDVAEKIHRKAIEYYKNRSGSIARAEEIYHRLRLGQSATKIKERWAEDLGPYLTPALEELAPRARAILADRLGVTLDARTLKDANQEDWERAAQRRADAYLKAGEFREALNVLSERKERLPSSELYKLEVNAQRGLGNLRKARLVANEGLDNAGKAGALLLTTKLLLLLALIDEEENQIDSALAHAEQAAVEARTLSEELDELRAIIACVRLLRKKETPAANKQRLALIDNVVEKVRKHDRKLPNHPALFREVVAELGDTDFDILKNGIAKLGFEFSKPGQVRDLARALAKWDEQLRSERKGGGSIGPLADLAQLKVGSKGGKEKPALEWKDWIERNSGSRLTKQILRFLDYFPTHPDAQMSLTEQFRSAVENTIHNKPVKRNKSLKLRK